MTGFSGRVLALAGRWCLSSGGGPCLHSSSVQPSWAEAAPSRRGPWRNKDEQILPLKMHTSRCLQGAEQKAKGKTVPVPGMEANSAFCPGAGISEGTCARTHEPCPGSRVGCSLGRLSTAGPCLGFPTQLPLQEPSGNSQDDNTLKLA